MEGEADSDRMSHSVNDRQAAFSACEDIIRPRYVNSGASRGKKGF